MTKKGTRSSRRTKKQPASRGVMQPARTAQPIQPPPKPASQPPPSLVPTIVAVGASAGGLEAFSQILDRLPSSPNVAFVFVQHLSPQHASALPELLAAKTPLPVVQATNGMEIEANHVYVMPPNVHMRVLDGELHLLPRPNDRTQFTPIDFFFESLARWAQERAIGVILSGTASDGSVGIAEIKALGGITIAQRPETAKHDGMPRAAIATGLVDLVLVPREIAEHLSHVRSHPYLLRSRVPEAADERRRLGRAASRDLRRAAPRQRHRLQAVQDSDGPAAPAAAHGAAPSDRRRRVRPVPRREPGRGRSSLSRTCSSTSRGSSAIPTRSRRSRLACSRETVRARRTMPSASGCPAAPPARRRTASRSAARSRWAIAAVERADPDLRHGRERRRPSSRRGPARIRSASPPTSRPSGCAASSRRPTAATACQDAARHVRLRAARPRRDPPFSRLDLVVCRNVLIYLDVPLQKRLISVFHYALKSRGFLMLGPAETTGPGVVLHVVDKKWRLFRKTPADVALPLTLPPERGRARCGAPRPCARRLAAPEGQVGAGRGDASHPRRYGPPGVIVDANLEIVQFRGHTGPVPRSGVRANPA